MRSTLSAVLLAWLFVACSATKISSAPTNALQIDGDVPARTLTLENLQALGPVDVEWKHRGETRKYEAISLEALLRSIGIDSGEMNANSPPSEKRAGWKFAVVATGSDGFQATFSVAEVFHGMGRTEAYVAILENGQPIDATFGPLRLVVTTDGEGSRSVRNLQRLTIVDLRRIVPSRSGAP